MKAQPRAGEDRIPAPSPMIRTAGFEVKLCSRVWGPVPAFEMNFPFPLL